MFRTHPTVSRVASAIALLLVVSGTTACGDPEVPETPIPDAGAPLPPPPPPPPVEPSVLTGPCDATMHLALQNAIQAREKKELGWGMKPEGAFNCENVAEGGKATVAVTLQPGRCYSFLAHSFPNVTEVDVFLRPNLGTTPSPLLAGFAGMVMAQDSESGPTATIGSGKDCYKNPFPIPGAAVAEVQSRTGAGPVAIQVYSK